MAEKKFWMAEAKKKMEEKGTVGSFGKATNKKIASGIKKGGVTEKKAVLARTFKKIAKSK